MNAREEMSARVSLRILRALTIENSVLVGLAKTEFVYSGMSLLRVEAQK